MHTIKLNINEKQHMNYENWTQDEIVNIGKVGLSSKSFFDDKEDYSKW